MSEFQTNAAGGYDNHAGKARSSGRGRQSRIQRTEGYYLYGDKLELNRDSYDDSILCLSLNLNGLKQSHWQAKNDKLNTFLKNYNFDIMGFQETNLNWDLIGTNDTWEERTIGWWKGGHTTVKAHNRQDVISSLHQPGGCMVTSVNSARRKVIECGVDQRGLGRWA